MKRIIAAFFFVLTLALAYRIFSHFSGGDFSGVLTLIAEIPLRIWVGVIPLVFLFYALDWVRFRSVLQVLGYRLGLRDGFSLTCVSYFVTSLTPTAELHTPAMVFMLSRKGIPLPKAFAASVTKSIYMTLWICVVSYSALFMDREVPLPEAVKNTLPFLTLPLLGLSALLGLIAFFPQPVSRWSQEMARSSLQGSLMKKIWTGMESTTQSISKIGTSGDVNHLICHLASICFLFAYVTIGYILALHFGIEISYFRAITVFSTGLMVAYLSPVPGSIGVTELTMSYMLDPALTQAGMATSLTLRLLCWYLVTVPGGAILANAFRKSGLNWKFPKGVAGGV